MTDHFDTQAPEPDTPQMPDTPETLDASFETHGEETQPFHKPGPNKRVCAFLIDSMLINLLYWKLSLYMAGWVPFLLLYAYLFFRDAFGGSGPGKLLVGLQVVDLDGRPQNLAKGFLRNLTMIFLPLQLIEYIFMLSNPEGRRLGDRLAKTVVRDTKPQLPDKLFLLLSVAVFVGGMLIAAMMSPGAKEGGKGFCPLRTKADSRRPAGSQTNDRAVINE